MHALQQHLLTVVKAGGSSFPVKQVLQGKKQYKLLRDACTFCRWKDGSFFPVCPHLLADMTAKKNIGGVSFISTSVRGVLAKSGKTINWESNRSCLNSWWCQILWLQKKKSRKFHIFKILPHKKSYCINNFITHFWIKYKHFEVAADVQI